MSIDELKKINLVDFLNQLGYKPVGRDSKGLWFYAPYRGERKPSFHVNPHKNVWFDFGTGAGGDIFTLAGEILGSTEFLRQADFIAEKMRLPVAQPYNPARFKEEPTFENIKVSPLESPTLLKYLSDRGIPRDLAQRYCVQVSYRLHGKDYYAIGFENNSHGYELRNPFFKGSFPPKHITHISNGNARCNVFEGFIDFLSAERLGFNDCNDVIVLNSVANVMKALHPLADYAVIQCYFDNDVAGRSALARIQREFGDKVMDKSAIYPDNKDLNDYLMSINTKQSTKHKLKL